jgi:uncharacterized phage-associated protein
MKIQKLVYILYAKYLASCGSFLFSHRFEVWQHGPALRDLYDAFKSYNKGVICDLHTDLKQEIWFLTATGTYGDCFEDVWYLYARKSANDLVKLLCQEGFAHHKAKVRGDYFLEDKEVADDGRWLFE